MSGGYPYTTAGGGLANPAIGRTRRTFTLRDGRCFDLMAASGQIPMTANTGPSPSTESPAPDDQLVLFGPPQPIRVRAELWRTWLDDPVIVSRFEVKRYLLRSAHACWIWTAGISSTGHGSFRAASLPGRSRRGTVPAHLFAYQLQHGVIPRLGWPGTDDPCLCHRCDEAGCVNPAHLRLGTTSQNRAEWAQRRRLPHSPLGDLRGAAGRARAVAATVREGLAAGESSVQIEERVRIARNEGLLPTLW
jgi:hypothetical protein